MENTYTNNISLTEGKINSGTQNQTNFDSSRNLPITDNQEFTRITPENLHSIPNFVQNSMKQIRKKSYSDVGNNMNQMPFPKTSSSATELFNSLWSVPLDSEEDLQILTSNTINLVEDLYTQQINNLKLWNLVHSLSQYGPQAQQALFIAKEELKKTADEALQHALKLISEAKEYMNLQQLQQYTKDIFKLMKVELLPAVQYFTEGIDALNSIAQEVNAKASNFVNT